MLKCGIYIRVSKDNMEQKTSLENQRDLFIKYAKEKNWEIIDFYVDVESGTSTKRKELARLLNDAENKRIDIMVKNGVLDEAKMLYDMNLDKDNTCIQAIGYKEFFEYFEGKENLDDAIEKLKKSTRHYAKRQITWFKNKLNCHYLEEYNNVSGMVNEIISDSKILEK